MQVIQANVAQSPQYQQQPTYWDRLLARLATLGQLGTQGWQAWQYGQQVDNQRAQIKQSVLKDVMAGHYGQPEAYNIFRDVGGFNHEEALRLSNMTKIQEGSKWLKDQQQRFGQRETEDWAKGYTGRPSVFGNPSMEMPDWMVQQ